MQTGIVETFSNAKGFGFIDVGPGKPQLFVHYSEIQMDGYKKLDKGDHVEFEVRPGPKGKPQACSVRIISSVPEGEV